MALRLTITGLVQGVGYRQWLRRRAERLGITGWVRNREDGSVEAVLAGTDEAVGKLLREAMTGPLGARVDSMDQQAIAEPDARQGFEIRPTI
jgi:acylphosphatase